MNEGGDADLRQPRADRAQREEHRPVQPDLLRSHHRQLQPVLDGRSRLGQPHVAHHRSSERPDAGADAGGAGAPRARAAAAWPVVVEGSESGPRGRADGPEDRPLSERCISYGAPRTGTGYNSYLQIVQSPEAVVVLQEMIHDARIVPMDGTAASAVERASAARRSARPLGRRHAGRRDDELHQRLPGLDAEREGHRALHAARARTTSTGSSRVIDPDTWVQPWTFMIRLKHVDEQLYEYACHEGNRSMIGILAGARADEAKAAAAAAKPVTADTGTVAKARATAARGRKRLARQLLVPHRRVVGEARRRPSPAAPCRRAARDRRRPCSSGACASCTPADPP